MALSRLELSVHNILQMSTTALMSGSINEAHHWFDRAVELNIKAEEMPQASMHSAFLAAVSQSGRLKEGLAHVEWLKRTYQTISIVDDHLLHMYGLPFFSVFLEKSFPILQASLPQEEINQWYKSMREHLSEDGQNILSSWLEVVL